LGSGETYAFTDDNDKFKGEVDITIPKTDKAKELDGSYAGYQPKPAVEVVIVAMKPLDQKGYLDQALDNGKGVTWLDDCRIPFAGMSDKENYTDERGWDKWGLSEDYEKYKKDNVGSQKNFDTEAEGLSRGNQPARKTTKRKPRTESNVFKTSGFKSEDNDTADASPFGRFAANLLVSDDVLNDGGSFSRYFSLDAWWENRVSKLPKEIQWTFPFLIIPKASKAEKNMGLEKGKFSKTIGHNRFDQCATCGGYILQNQDRPSACKCENPVRKDNTIKGNFHPTVKPFQLFSYLVTLGSRKDDVVLDPFAGSGTTGISCVFEDRKFICIEREKEYFDIMESRIEKAKNPEGLVDHEFWE
jgi:site-specific DNA-methyltransferase (adenine-specific)